MAYLEEVQQLLPYVLNTHFNDLFQHNPLHYERKLYMTRKEKPVVCYLNHSQNVHFNAYILDVVRVVRVAIFPIPKMML